MTPEDKEPDEGAETSTGADTDDLVAKYLADLPEEARDWIMERPLTAEFIEFVREWDRKEKKRQSLEHQLEQGIQALSKNKDQDTTQRPTPLPDAIEEKARTDGTYAIAYALLRLGEKLDALTNAISTPAEHGSQKSP